MAARARDGLQSRIGGHLPTPPETDGLIPYVVAALLAGAAFAGKWLLDRLGWYQTRDATRLAELQERYDALSSKARRLVEENEVLARLAREAGVADDQRSPAMGAAHEVEVELARTPEGA